MAKLIFLGRLDTFIYQNLLKFHSLQFFHRWALFYVIKGILLVRGHLVARALFVMIFWHLSRYVGYVSLFIKINVGSSGNAADRFDSHFKKWPPNSERVRIFSENKLNRALKCITDL